MVRSPLHRCSGNLARYFGDVNGDGRLDNDDIARFRIGLNGTRLPYISTGDYFNFGYISAVWNFDGNPSPGANDGNVAVQIVLGVRPCM